MKWLISLSIILLAVSYSQATIAITTHTATSSPDGNSVTTPGVTTTGANLLVVIVAYYHSGTFTSLTDSKSNTWGQLTDYTFSGANGVRVYYSTGPIVGTSHTFTITGSNIYPSITMSAWSGVSTAPFDKENGATGIGVSQPGNVAPSEDNELIITGSADSGASTYTIDSGFTITDQLAQIGGLALSSAMAYIINGAGTSGVNVNPTWTAPAAGTAINIATFKAAPAASFGPINNPVFSGF